jgi:hypothetical protein
MTLKLILDLDDVILNLALPLLEYWDVGIATEDQYPREFGWDIRGAINHLGAKSGQPHKYPVPPAKQFWAHMSLNWWAARKPHDGALGFVEWLETGPFDIFISTAHVNSPHAAAKFDWVDKWLPQYASKTFVGRDKTAFAGLGAILIDDRKKNCDDFDAAGGSSVLFPRPWNPAYRSDAVCPYWVAATKLNRVITSLGCQPIPMETS